MKVKQVKVPTEEELALKKASRKVYYATYVKKKQELQLNGSTSITDGAKDELNMLTDSLHQMNHCDTDENKTEEATLDELLKRESIERNNINHDASCYEVI